MLPTVKPRAFGVPAPKCHVAELKIALCLKRITFSCYIKSRLIPVSLQFKPRGKAFVALLLVGIVLLLDAMAASPALHELIHKDADSPDHQCAVTLFAHGQVDSTVVEVAPIVLTPPIETVSPVFLPVFASCLQYLPSGRAPPFRSVVA
jgi:hypothetical protein